MYATVYHNLRYVQSCPTVRAKAISIRLYSNQYTSAAIQERAIRALKGRFIKGIEDNPDLWLGEAAVDTATVSILDPCPMYASKAWTNSILNVPARDSCAGEDNSILDPHQHEVDPFLLVKDEMQQVTASIKRILGTDHPVLSAASKYFFNHDGGKKVRPTMVLLMSQAASCYTPHHRSSHMRGYILAAQQRLAEITEMIHTATLLHDDVIDEAETRRGLPSVNQIFGDKLSILAGDFLLARSSICLARLRNVQVVEIMSTIIEHLVKGEVMQMRDASSDSDITPFEYYLRKSYYKTGSLMANSCKAVLKLGQHSDAICEMGFAFGRHAGLAFQLIDDILDYEGYNTGKGLHVDIKSGIVTAPLLLAEEQMPELRVLIDRKFVKENDIQRALEMVQKSNAMEKTMDLAKEQAHFAGQAIKNFPDSLAKIALLRLAQMIVTRTK